MAIYMDNAATTNHKPDMVVKALNEYIQNNSYGNPLRGVHDFSIDAYNVVDQARENVKRLFNAGDAYTVGFNYNATSVLNIVIKGLINPNDEVITSYYDHNATLRPLYQLEKEYGVKLKYIPLDENQVLDLCKLENLISDKTKAIVINHASNVTGNVVDLQYIKEICCRHNLKLIVDVSQSAGVYPIDLSDNEIDCICFTGHKSLYGITGIGGCCIKKTLKLNPVLSGGDGVYAFEKEYPATLPNVIEVGTINTVGCVGLSAGINYLLSLGMDQIVKKQKELHDYFLSKIVDLQNIKFYGNIYKNHLNVFSFNFKNIDSAIIADELWSNFKIATRSGFHCAPLMHEALKTTKQGAVRVSFSLFTTKEEIDELSKALHIIDQEVEK